MSNKFEQLLEFSKRRNGRHIAGLELGAGFAVGSVVVGGGAAVWAGSQLCC
jgi:hypothetical protein